MIRMVYSSRRPISISSASSSFAGGFIHENVFMGEMRPKPGPALLMQVAEAEIEVIIYISQTIGRSVAKRKTVRT